MFHLLHLLGINLMPIPAIRLSSRLEIFLLSLQELPAVALPTQEK
jgi:hypothetical protein